MSTTTIVNTTDATQGEPLAQRVRARRAELERILAQTPSEQLTARGDLVIALSHVDDLLGGDSAHPSEATAAQMSRWLEDNKHLAERARDQKRHDSGSSR